MTTRNNHDPLLSDAEQPVTVTWLELLLNKPFVGMTRGSRVLHAVDDPIPRKGRVTLDARCGRRVKLAQVWSQTETGERMLKPLRWRPRVADLADGVVLCDECKRPHERPVRSAYRLVS